MGSWPAGPDPDAKTECRASRVSRRPPTPPGWLRQTQRPQGRPPSSKAKPVLCHHPHFRICLLTVCLPALGAGGGLGGGQKEAKPGRGQHGGRPQVSPCGNPRGHRPPVTPGTAQGCQGPARATPDEALPAPSPPPPHPPQQTPESPYPPPGWFLSQTCPSLLLKTQVLTEADRKPPRLSPACSESRANWQTPACRRGSLRYQQSSRE